MKKLAYFVLALFAVTAVIGCGGKNESGDVAKNIVPIIATKNIEEIRKAANKKNVNIPDESGVTPLIYATKNIDNPEIIDILAKVGADINGKDKDGYTPLMIAIRKKSSHPEIAIALIMNGADVNATFDKPYDDEDKTTPLMYAVSYLMENKSQVIKALIDAGADVNAKNSIANTPLLIASGNAMNPENINMLIKAGANIEERNRNGYTPLMIAIRSNNGFIDIALTLIRNGADVNATFDKPYDDEDKTTPLMYAVSYLMDNRPQVIKALIDTGADVNAKNSIQMTPLLFAATNSHHSENIELLLNAGADIEAKDKNGRTPLMRAVRYNQTFPQTPIALIKGKANVNAKLENDTTVLMDALDFNASTKENVIQALIDHKANINAKNENGVTPLMMAAKDKDETIVKLLLKHGADMSAKDRSGRTALNYLQNNFRIKEKDLSKLK